MFAICVAALLAVLGASPVQRIDANPPVAQPGADAEQANSDQEPGQPEPAAATQPRDLAGSASCRECHEVFYGRWAPSRHGLAMQPYTAEFAAANLRPHEGEIEVGKHRYRADIRPDHGWVLERGPDGERKLPIAHVLGGKNVYYFLTPGERGRLQTLPTAYDVRRQAWFDTARSGIRHFAGGTEDEPLHWTDREYTFNTSCHSCHVSQLSTNYDLTTDTYHTEWAEPGINCETCHGPGGEHVRVCREAGMGEQPRDLKIISTRVFSAEQTNAMCAPCHAKMVAVTITFRPGDRYFDHFGLITLEHSDFYPDGRDLGENYTYTSWRMSPCLRSEQFDCLHCHTSSGRFRFRDEPNRSCLPCHQERVENAAAHTHHLDSSVGNECIACHMPKTEFARMIRSDHSMRPPTPATTLAYESPNACNLCHTDMDADWADRWVRQWRTRDYQAPVLRRAGLIDAARKEDWARLPDMLAFLSSPECDEIHATSLVRLLRSCEDDRTWPAFIRALENPSPLVRAAAAEALGGYITRESLPALLKATRDEYRLVRVRAASALAAAPQDALREEDRRHLEAATAEFVAAMQARPDDYSSHYNLGIFYAERGEYERAVACYEMASKLEPRGIAPLVNVSIVYNLLGRNDKAEQKLRQALHIEPKSVAANLNLGMLLGEMGRPREAEAAFRTALHADPKCAAAAYNIGVAVAERDLTEAIELCHRAHKLRPGEPKYAFAVAFYLRQAGRADEAVMQLRQLVAEHPSYVDGYVTLGELLEEQGRTAEAADVYFRAAGNDGLPRRVREQFDVRARMLSR